MTFFKSNGENVPAHVADMANEARAGRMDRREFLALASALGSSATLFVASVFLYQRDGGHLARLWLMSEDSRSHPRVHVPTSASLS